LWRIIIQALETLSFFMLDIRQLGRRNVNRLVLAL
jgi:hypothetical protein